LSFAERLDNRLSTISVNTAPRKRKTQMTDEELHDLIATLRRRGTDFEEV
jgi:hypothetical protein